MEQREYFSSRWMLLLSVLGMAVGTGNIWRFPRVLAQNGGWPFLLVYIVVLFSWAIPLMMVEFGMGKASRMGTVGAFAKVIGRRGAWMGAFVGFCTMGIMFYYSVVAGWCLKYLSAALGLGGGLLGTEPGAYWGRFIGSLTQPVVFHLLAMGIGVAIVLRGVVRGIERANRVLIPALFLLLIAGAIRAVTLPGATAGLNFLFTPKWSGLVDYRVWLEALSQAAWSTGAGWGLILTYAVYMREREDIGLNSLLVGLGDATAALLAGLIIIPTVFALLPLAEAMEVMNTTNNEGLAFIWIPQLFSQMPAGRLFLIIFFLALASAAISSLISMIELGSRILMDGGIDRRRAVLTVGVVGFLLGLPSAAWLGFFQNQDWTWGIGLMVSGLFFAGATIRYGPEAFRTRLINAVGRDWEVGAWFDVVIKYLIPLQFIALIGWWFFKAITQFDPEGWWNPFRSFSVGTCILQWGGALMVFLFLNRWMAERTLGSSAPTQST